MHHVRLTVTDNDSNAVVESTVYHKVGDAWRAGMARIGYALDMFDRGYIIALADHGVIGEHLVYRPGKPSFRISVGHA